MNHFNVVNLEVWDLDHSDAMSVMKGELCKSRFFFSLKKRYPKDFIEILAQMEKYANTEEAMSTYDEPSKGVTRMKRGRSKEQKDLPC